MKIASLEHTSINVLPAAPDRWKDMEEIFGTSACWCQYWRQSASEYGRGAKVDLKLNMAKHKDALRAQLELPTPPGMLAYIEDQAVGWCGFGPRSEMERLVRSRTIPAIDALPVWSIVCFMIRVGYRRRGVARALLRGAIDCAREYGAPVLEAYPVDPGGRRIDTAFAYVGILSMFEQEGFQRIVETSARSAGLPRWLVRLDLTPVS
jgi:GNAT superfamily N-acetyltransferase